MAKRTGTAHVVTTIRKYKNRVYRTHLLRRSYREDGKVKNETLGNLSHLPDSLIDIIRRSLQGETVVPL
ncbi:MAG: transposase, partial [Proteobacteria bacterium]|nr:transposase [Pseudomonadota bacterium]